MIRFNKARFRHYSKKKLDSMSNKYVRVLYAIYVIIKDNKVIAELNFNPAKLLKELNVKYVEELND